jgi:hypothetical protein
VIFNWSKKIIHVPTIAASFIAALIVSWRPDDPKLNMIVGAVWFAVWLFCHTIEEYDFNLAVCIAMFVSLVLFMVLIVFAGLMLKLCKFVAEIDITASPHLYLGVGLIYLVSVAISYVKGLFYYVALEPNQMVVQYRIGEDGQTFQRARYDATIEATHDIFEWFFYDMATLTIHFRDGKNPPLQFFITGIRKKADKLGDVLGVTAIDREDKHQPN